MGLDAIIIADSGVDSLSVTHSLKLSVDGRSGSIQVILNYLKHGGRVVPPVEGDNVMNWASAPNLNGIYLLSYLARKNYQVELINAYFEQRDQFIRLLDQNPRTVILSTTFMHGKRALRKLVDDIRSLAPEIFIVAGGPLIHMSYLVLQKTKVPHYDTDAAKKDFLFIEHQDEPRVDLYVISLRGEQLLCEILDRLRRNKAMDHLPNTARINGTSYDFSPRIDDTLTAGDGDVDWANLPDRIFHSGVIPMQASTGCPYHCAFCNFTKDRRYTYLKPVDRLVAELKTVSQLGVQYVWFVDDNFRLGKADIHDVCRRFIREGIDVRWMTFVRASAINRVDPQLLRQAGCAEVQLGLESADIQVLRNMNKQSNPALYAEAVEKLLAAGIHCSCYFIFGFPGETDQSAQRTRKFIQRIEHPEHEGTLSWSMFPFMLSPLSPIYAPEMRKKYGLTGYMDKWTHRTMDSVQARDHVRKAFFEMDNSGPIYRDDNLDRLQNLGPRQRKAFVAVRHKMAKLSLKNRLTKPEMLSAFHDLFPG